MQSPPHVALTFAAQFLGTYQFGENFYNPDGKVRITYTDGLLLSDGAPMIPVIDENGKIIKFINRQYWSRLEFQADDKGIIKSLKFDGYVGKK